MIRYIEQGFKCYIAEAEDATLWAFVAVKPGHPWHGVQHFDTNMAGLMWTGLTEDHKRHATKHNPRCNIALPGEWLFGVEIDPGAVPEEELELVAREAVWSLTHMLRGRVKR